MNKLKIRIFFTFVLFGMLSTHLKARIRKKTWKAREGSLLQGLAFLKEGGRERQGPLHINSIFDLPMFVFEAPIFVFVLIEVDQSQTMNKSKNRLYIEDFCYSSGMFWNDTGMTRRNFHCTTQKLTWNSRQAKNLGLNPCFIECHGNSLHVLVLMACDRHIFCYWPFISHFLRVVICCQVLFLFWEIIYVR